MRSRKKCWINLDGKRLLYLLIVLRLSETRDSKLVFDLSFHFRAISLADTFTGSFDLILIRACLGAAPEYHLLNFSVTATSSEIKGADRHSSGFLFKLKYTEPESQ